MSVPQSKSKTSLAYARPSKVTSKTKINNKSNVESNSKNVEGSNKKDVKNPAGNIYESILGQIEGTQQEYIKGLIVKNQKEEKKAKNLGKQGGKKSHQPNLNSQKKIPSAQQNSEQNRIKNHERTKSQTQLLKIIVNQNESQGAVVDLETSKDQDIKNQIKPQISNKKTNFEPEQSNFPRQAVEASFNREIRETHKKVGPSYKQSTKYYSCQISPQKSQIRDSVKKIIHEPQYIKELIQTSNTQKEEESKIMKKSGKEKKIYVAISNETSGRPVSKSPIVTPKNSKPQLFAEKKNEFLSTIDDYLEQISNMNTHTGFYQGSRGSHPGRGRKSQPDLSQELGQSESLVREVQENKNSLKILQTLQRERQKVQQLKLALKFSQSELIKSQKKEKKLKKNQHEILNCLKEVNFELQQEKRERRKLEKVMRMFDNNLRQLQRSENRKQKYINRSMNSSFVKEIQKGKNSTSKFHSYEKDGLGVESLLRKFKKKRQNRENYLQDSIDEAYTSESDEEQQYSPNQRIYNALRYQKEKEDNRLEDQDSQIADLIQMQKLQKKAQKRALYGQQSFYQNNISRQSSKKKQPLSYLHVLQHNLQREQEQELADLNRISRNCSNKNSRSRLNQTVKLVNSNSYNSLNASNIVSHLQSSQKTNKQNDQRGGDVSINPYVNGNKHSKNNSYMHQTAAQPQSVSSFHRGLNESDIDRLFEGSRGSAKCHFGHPNRGHQILKNQNQNEIEKSDLGRHSQVQNLAFYSDLDQGSASDSEFPGQYHEEQNYAL